MNELVTVLWQSLLVIMLADFIAGIVHWFEDAYVRENTPLIGSFIGKANVIHHHLPRYMTRNNWWQSSWDLLAFSAFIVLGAAWLDFVDVARLALCRRQRQRQSSPQMVAPDPKRERTCHHLPAKHPRVAVAASPRRSSHQSQKCPLLPDHQSRESDPRRIPLLGWCRMDSCAHLRAESSAGYFPARQRPCRGVVEGIADSDLNPTRRVAH